jgi:hypothetical protein
VAEELLDAAADDEVVVDETVFEDTELEDELDEPEPEADCFKNPAM